MRGARSEECICIPQSPFPSPQPRPRSGLSLTETLIAMGILTLGLLGVAAVFPVGSFYMMKAEIADRGSAIAQSVMNDIMARGMLNPRAWYVEVPNPTVTNSSTSPNAILPGIDGKYSPKAPDLTGSQTSSTFTRPFAEALAEGLKRNTDVAVLAKQFGHAYVIDPIFASMAASTTVTSNNLPAYPFPSTAYARYPWPSSTYYGTRWWDPWRSNNKTSASEKTWPIRRVTFRQSSGWPLDRQMAEHFFRGSDDLATDMPSRDDRPPIQTWQTTGSAHTPLARDWNGDYSWIVSVVPTTNAARDGMARNPEGFSYDVSVVVFYKRPLPTSAPGTDVIDASSNERMVGAKIVSTGLNGGELLLSDMNDVTVSSTSSTLASPFTQLRVGDWIMLCGPHPNSNVVVGTNLTNVGSATPSTGEPKFVLNWYQVLSIDAEGTGITGFNSSSQRVIAVRGVQWPWQPAAKLTDTTQLSNDLCVAICRGAVAVHTKTIRLEGYGSAWSIPAGGSGGGDGGFGSGGDPTGAGQSPWTLH
jgi:hypothetical protein